MSKQKRGRGQTLEVEGCKKQKVAARVQIFEDVLHLPV